MSFSYALGAIPRAILLFSILVMDVTRMESPPDSGGQPSTTSELGKNDPYFIAPEDCMKMEKVGCFADHYNDRVLDYEIPPNIRDSTNKNYQPGIDWKNYDYTLQQLACRCAESAQKLGLKYFGLQFYGECWAGNDSYAKLGKLADDKCTGDDFRPCDDKHEYCVGGVLTNFVYGLSPTPPPPGNEPPPPPPPTNKPTPPPSPPPGNEPPPPPPTTNEPPTSDLLPDPEEEEDEEDRAKRVKKACPKSDFDLAFAIDSSGSIKEKDFERSLAFVLKVLRLFKIGANHTNVAALSFSNIIRPLFDFNDAISSSRKDIYSYFYNMPKRTAGKTWTRAALARAYSRFFCPTCTNRNKPKVLVLLTDGKSNDKLPIAFKKIVKPMMKAGVSIISVGVGKKVDKKELKAIASPKINGKGKYVVNIKSFRKMKNYVKKLARFICNTNKGKGKGKKKGEKKKDKKKGEEKKDKKKGEKLERIEELER